MEYTDELPDRWWITRPDRHPELDHCQECHGELLMDHSVPMLRGVGAVCGFCAVKAISNIHPVTTTWLEWFDSGDQRWWSSSSCNLECCVPEETKEDGDQEQEPILTTCFHCGKPYDFDERTQAWLCPECRK